MFFSFFGNKKENPLPVSIQDVPDIDDFIVIDIPEFEYLSDEEENPAASVQPQQIENALALTAEEANAHIEKCSRRLVWESRNKKIAARVHDEAGHTIEIRFVNHGKQLAFWDEIKNTQVYVFRKANTQELETKDKGVLKRVK